jgi:hypothetical protein
MLCEVNPQQGLFIVRHYSFAEVRPLNYLLSFTDETKLETSKKLQQGLQVTI